MGLGSCQLASQTHCYAELDKAAAIFAVQPKPPPTLHPPSTPCLSLGTMLTLRLPLHHRPGAAGLITYRETALLVSDSSSALDRRYVSLVVAHEMAHQWFGNLVTLVSGQGELST